MDYQSFLESKTVNVVPTGISQPVELNAGLFPYQQDIVKWALRRGRAAIFSNTGTGKTRMQLEWAKHVANHTQGNVLILAPLAVNLQTVAEGEKLGIQVHPCRSQSDVKSGINITNYEMLHHFDPGHFAGVVIDESSCLKAYSAATTKTLIESFANTRFKLACTATPAPNDYTELGNHAEFLGVMRRSEMMPTFFINDLGDVKANWRLKGHAAKDFWKWLCKWSVMLQKPSDLGYSDEGFILPPLNIHHHVVDSAPSEGQLFAFEARTLQERQQARKASIDDRVAKAAELVNDSDQPFLIWCNLNEEADKLQKLIPGSVNVQGSDKSEKKEQGMMDFTNGKIRVLISKPSICGFGMNWQHCNQVAYVGLSDSWEQYYQSVRRCYRFGQTRPVDVHIITSESEGAVVANIKRKEEKAEQMSDAIVNHMRTEMNIEIRDQVIEEEEYKEDIYQSDKCTLYLGDCVEQIKKVPDESVHFSIFSPPFSSLYTFSSSQRDMSNNRGYDQFMTHMEFLVKELFRTLKPGRLVSFHCINMPTTLNFHGYIGIVDFRGDLIRMFQKMGFIYHSEVVIWKDPVVAMQRTKALGLLYKQLKKDSAMSRQGIPDYLVTMRKPGENNEPVTKDPDDFPVQLWQNYASPVWMDIVQGDTLQHRSAREHEDERHIAPLQLDVIRRALKLWTNPGDTVLTPFLGIGSEAVVSLEEGRKAIGIELKQSYYRQAVKNCEFTEKHKKDQLTLLDMDAVDDASYTDMGLTV